MRTVSYRIGDLNKAVIHIGRVAENDYTRVQIDAGEIYAEYPHAAASLTVQPPEGEAFPAVVTRDGDLVIWDVPDSALTAEGNGEIQLTFTSDEVVVKSAIGRISICRSIVGEGEAPDPLEDFLAEAGAALTAIPETIDAALQEAKDSGEFDGPAGPAGQDGQPGADGAPGADGFSPSASVTKSGSTATIVITDKDGTTTAQISDGSGANVIDDTAGTGDTDVTWSADKLTSEKSDVLNAINNSAPIAIGKSSGAVALFKDGSDGKQLSNLKVQIVPQQEGSGVPSPSNIRNMTALTGLTVYQSGEDTSNPTTKSVSWQTEAGTVYYGSLDVITGVLTVEGIGFTFDGSSDENWTYNNYNEYNKYKYYISLSSYDVAKGEDRQDVIFCNWLKPEVNGAFSNYIYGTNTASMSISYKWLFVALDISTVDALKAELAQHPLQVVVRLNTPITYNITPIEIETIYGVNNLWSNAGDILLCEYKADTSLYVKEEIDSREVSPQTEVKVATLEDDTITVIEELMIRKNLDIEFKAMITDFTSITIGHGYNEDGAAYFVIDDTNVTVFANTGTQKAQYAHGLTIGTYIRVLVQQDDKSLARLSIYTLSGKFDKTGVEFNGCTGDIFATVDGEMTDVSLIAVLHDINNPIWFFGDSYQAMTATAGTRWPFYLREDGYMVNTLFCGRYGAFAQTLIPSFRKLIAMKKPKIVCWCLGMNGSDDSNGNINVQWRDATREVIETCAEKGISLILATIPNVPERRHTGKNAYVKNTGLRYIDFAKAVGAEEAGSSWYTGMLSSDDLHPSDTGAMALYAQILADLPEVMQNVQRGYDVWEGGSY